MRTRAWTARVRVAMLAAVLAGTLAGSLGYSGGAEADSPPSPIVTPTVNPDGSYQVGSLPDRDAADAVKAAADALPVAFSYDYRSLETSLAKATALMTPEFAAKFRSTFETTTVRIATAKKAITSALVRGAGFIGPVRDGQVTCLVYLDQVLVSSKDKRPKDPLKVSQNSVHVKLRKSDGKWLVDDIEPF